MVAMTRAEWAFSRPSFGRYGVLPAVRKTPLSGGLPAIDLAQVATRETAQSVADAMSRAARGAYDSAVPLFSPAGFPDAAEWKNRIQQQADSAVGFRNQVFNATAATQINWPFVKTTLQNAWNAANMALATLEQLRAAAQEWSSGRAQLAGKVVLYEHVNYGGNYQVFPPGEYPTERFTSIGYHIASSIKIPPGYVVTIFASPHFGAGTATLTTSNPDLRGIGWNDRIGSIRVETQAMAAQRSQIDAARQLALAQAESQRQQIEAARQAAELQVQLARQGQDAAALAQAQEDLERARAEMAAWEAEVAAAGAARDVSVSVSGGGGGAGEAPAIAPDGSLAEPRTSPFLYAAIGIAAVLLLKR